MISLLRRVHGGCRARARKPSCVKNCQFHLGEEAEERLAAGLKVEEARSAAQRDLGNEARVREDVRAVWTWRPLDELTQDVRYALRTMVDASRGEHLRGAVARARHRRQHRDLQLHGGGAAADAAGADPDSLVVMTWRAKPFAFARPAGRVRPAFNFRADVSTSDGGVEAASFRIAGSSGYARPQPVLSSIFTMFRGGRMNVLIDGQAELTEAQYVSGDFFSGLAIPPGAGRLFVADDDRPNADTGGGGQRRLCRPTIRLDRGSRRQADSHQQRPVHGCRRDTRGIRRRRAGRRARLYVPMQANVSSTAMGPHFADPNYYWVEIMGDCVQGVSRAGQRGAARRSHTGWRQRRRTRFNAPIFRC